MFASLNEIAEERQELEARTAAWLGKVADYDRSGDWRAEGFLSAAAAIRSACRMDPGQTRGFVRLARRLEQFPHVADAFAGGEISEHHARAVADAYTPERAAVLTTVESSLVDAGRVGTPSELVRMVRYVTDAIDGDGGAEADAAAHEARGCVVGSSGDSMYFKGNCDRLMGEAFLAAVNAEMKRDLQVDEQRSTPARRMDAIARLLQLPLDRGELGETHGVRPHISVVMDVQEFPGPTSEAPGVKVPAEPRRNSYSQSMLEMLLCDCDVSRVLVSGKSEVLDVGRATRTIPSALWKALVVRDRYCQAPGCDRGPDQCQAHHVVHWTRGGPTNLQNLRLLCWNHHREQHRHDAQARAA